MTIRTLAVATALCAALGTGTLAIAQQQPAPASEPRYMHRFDDLNLSDQQRAQIQDATSAFRQAHPKGSEPDPAARKALRAQILGVLTPDQRSKFISEQRARREAAHAQAPQPQPTP